MEYNANIGNKKINKIKLIHYNLGSKPWHFDDIPYARLFLEICRKNRVYNEIREIKNNYTDEDKIKDDANSTKLIELAQKEADCVGDDRIKEQGTKGIIKN